MDVIKEKKEKNSVTIFRPDTPDGVYVVIKRDLSPAETNRVHQVASYWGSQGWEFHPRLPVQGELSVPDGYYGTAMMHDTLNPEDDEIMSVVPKRVVSAAIVKLHTFSRFNSTRGGDGRLLTPALVYYVISDQEGYKTEAQPMARLLCLDDEELVKRLAHISGIITTKHAKVSSKDNDRLMLYPSPSFSSAEELHKFNIRSVEDVSVGNQVEVVCAATLGATAVIRVPTAPGEQREVVGTNQVSSQVIFRPNPGYMMFFRPWLDELLSQLPSELFEKEDSRYIVTVSMSSSGTSIVNCEHIAVATVWTDIRSPRPAAVSVVRGKRCEACTSDDIPYMCVHTNK